VDYIPRQLVITTSLHAAQALRITSAWGHCNASATGNGMVLAAIHGHCLLVNG
jgi:hypothetical protein